MKAGGLRMDIGKKDKDGNDKWIDTSYWHEHMVTYPNLYTFKYDAWVEDERAGAPQNAATLYQISRAKIYNEVRRVTVKVGENIQIIKYI